MKLKLCLVMMMAVAVAEAKGPPFYQKGTLVKMESAECGVDTRGTALDVSDHSKARQMLCQQYLLRGDKLDYEIRPKEEKHPAILPVGQEAEFRIEKDRMHLRVPELDKKEREFIVVAISQRAEEEKPVPATETAAK